MAVRIAKVLIMMFFTVALSANAAAFKDVATVTRARCYSNCITEVGKLPPTPETSCPTGDFCKECIKPCQTPFTTINNCRSNCKNSAICLKSCNFLLALKTKGNVLQGKNTITNKPGIPVEVTKNVTSITLSWKPANTSEGNVVYLLKERATGDFNIRLSDFKNLVFFQPKAVLSVKQVCMFTPRFRFKFNGIKFFFTAVALTENSSLVASAESSAIEMTRPNPVVRVANPSFRYDPRPFGDRLRLTTTVVPPSGQENLITNYGMAWSSARSCKPLGLPRSVLSSGKSRNITMHIYQKLKACDHTLKVYSLIQCIPSVPATLKYRYRGCRFVDNFNKTFCHSFDPPPTPDSARAVRNLRHSPLQITDDFRVNTTFLWVPPSFPFGKVTFYRVAYGDVARLVLGRIWIPTIATTKTPSLSVANLLPNITVRVEVTPYFPNAGGVKRTITFRTPAVPEDKINIKNVQPSKFTFSPKQLFSVRVTWQRPVLTKGLLGYKIAILRNNNQKSKASINATSTSYLLTRIEHKEPLKIEIQPAYSFKWIKPNIVTLKLKAPAPDVREVIVRNLKLSGYTYNKHDHAYAVKFTWDAPTFAIYKTVDHYKITFHLIGSHGHHVHCPSFGKSDLCPATNKTSYLIPKVAPWQYTILTVTPVFKNSFVDGISRAISIDPLEFTCKGKKPGFYKDPLDCTAFYHCSYYGQIEHFHCQKGLYWNNTMLACVWMRKGSCKQQTVSSFSCDGKPNGYYPDPESCGSFYQCHDHRAYWESCPEGLYWNKDINTCDWPRNVHCYDDKLN